jgi:hypothetical protein
MAAHVTAARDRESLLAGGLPTQYVDVDPDETSEWVGSLDHVVEREGNARARYLMLQLLRRAAELQVGVPGGKTAPVFPEQAVPDHVDWDRWVGPAPMTPFHENKAKRAFHENITNFSLGMISCWGIHHLDIAQWGCPEITTKPFTIQGIGEFPQSGMTDTCCRWDVTLSYDSGLKVHFTDHSKQPNGCRFIGDKGWVWVDRGGFDADHFDARRQMVCGDREGREEGCRSCHEDGIPK